MTMTTIPTPLQTWLEVCALATEAARRDLTRPGIDTAAHSLALGAELVACQAQGLLDVEAARLVDDVVLPAEVRVLDVAGLLRAAEAATRRRPIEQLPVGASAVIVALGDLIAETCA